VPGDTAADRGYWRDVGTLDAYHRRAHGSDFRHTAFSLYNSHWPILSWPEPLPPAKFVFEEEGRTGQAVDSLVCAGVIVSGGRVRRSILSPGVRVHSFAEVDSSVLLHGVDVGRDAIVRNAILDKNVQIADGAQIGVDPEADRERFVVSDGGIVVIGRARGSRRAEGRAAHAGVPLRVYGGAGVHVEYLARDLARLVDPDGALLGRERPSSKDGPAARAYRPWAALAGGGAHAPGARGGLDRPRDGGRRRRRCAGAQPHLVRQPRGHLAKLLYGIPHVATVHSLEPMRPWKAEQLAGGYAVSSFCERTALEAADAVIAVSEEQARDVLACYPAVDPGRLSVIYNGIDTECYRPDPGTEVLARYASTRDVPPWSSSAGSPARRAWPTRSRLRCSSIRPRSSCSARSAPDTPEIAAEIEAKVARVRGERGNIIWIDRMLERDEVVQIVSRATVFPVPVDLRAPRHRQPRGDGLRDGRRGDAHGRHPRSRRGRRHGTARPVSSRATTDRATPSTPSASPATSPSA